MIEQVTDLLTSVVRSGHKIMWCGNGGSAADSQHLAAELVGRYKRNREAIASLALTTDTSVLTAIANDFGYENVFSRQVQALGKKGDALIALTTSGRSQSILNALDTASLLGIHTIIMTGSTAPEKLANYEIRINSTKTEMIQQCHTAIGHIISEILERNCDD